jgi:hypothetical protein
MQSAEMGRTRRRRHRRGYGRKAMTNRALLWFAMGAGIGGLIVVVLALVVL